MTRGWAYGVAAAVTFGVSAPLSARLVAHTVRSAADPPYRELGMQPLVGC